MFKMQHDLDKVRFCITGITPNRITYSHECLQMHLRSHLLAACRLHFAARDARPLQDLKFAHVFPRTCPLPPPLDAESLDAVAEAAGQSRLLPACVVCCS